MQLNRIKNMSVNDKIVVKNTFFAFLIKGLALSISLLSTPAFIKYFNNNAILGIWYTLLSVLIWFLNFDLGIGNGIRNSLVKALTLNDRREAKCIISSGMVSVAVVSIFLSIGGFLILLNGDLNVFFNISRDLISQQTLFISTMCVFAAIMLRFILTTVSSIFYALQMSSVNNFLSLCVSCLQLLYVLTIHFDDPETALLNLSLAYMIISNLPVLIAGIIVFMTKLKDCKPNIHFADKLHIKNVLKIGGIFFVCQILYMLIVNTNEFFITKFFGPEFTTEYTFYYKLSSLVSMIVTLAMTPIWSIVTKAMTEGNWKWLSALIKKIQCIGLIVIGLEFLIIPFLQFIMNIWLREATISVNYSIAVAFACFGSVFVYSSMLSTIVCGLARMRLQAICYSIGVFFKFVFIIGLSKITDNWSIVVWSNFILLLPYCVVQQIDLNNYIKNKIKYEGGN